MLKSEEIEPTSPQSTMMKKKFGRMGKSLLLLAGVSLSGLIVLEIGQQVVEALELDHIPGRLGSQQHNPLANLWAVHPDQSTQATPSQQSSEATSTKNVVSNVRKPQSIVLDFSTHSLQNPTPQPQAAMEQMVTRQITAQQTVALNDGAATDSQQPVSRISPNQIATSNWNGASFPVENFQAYTSPFGYRSSPDGGYTQEFHYGLDMAAPEGSYIRNWWGGKVVEVSDNTNCGTSVVLESGSWTHIYCHMEGHVEKDDKGSYMVDREGGILIRQGQEIPAGGRIGRVGMTGRTTGPHLHWGLKYNGNWVDPAYVLRAMYSSQQAMQPTANRIQ